MIRIRILLLFMTLTAGGGAAAQTAGGPDEALDVLFIAIDDLNDWVGYLGGHPQTSTPNIDRLAARGLAFMNAHTPATICNAARTALLSGLRPASTGIYGNAPDWRTQDRFDDVTTLPRHFRNHGYRTLGAGKIFHAHTFNPGGFTGYNDTTAWDAFYPGLDRQLPDEVAPPIRPANRNPIDRSFDWGAVVTDDRAMGDGQDVAWVVRQLAAETGAPRFVAAGIYRPHLPWFVPQAYFDLHPLESIELPAVAPDDLEDVPPPGRRSTLNSVELFDWTTAEDRWDEAVQAYLASVSFADTMVGELLDALDASGRADRTIIVLWGDHGFHLGEKGRFRKMTLWEESTHVPFIIVAPGVTTPGSRTDRAVSLLDIYPTLTELAGLDTPEHMDGRSLVPLLEDPSRDWDYPVLTTYGYKNHAIRSNRHRYIRYSDGSEELYDHTTDPHEWHNLADDPDLAAVKAELARSLPASDAEDLFVPRRPQASED